MKKQVTQLARNPKQPIIRLRVMIHRKPNSNETAMSYTDTYDIEHRTQFCKSIAAATAKLIAYIKGVTGIGRVSLIVVAEVMEK